MWLEALGWTATAIFASSYFFKKAAALRGIQAAAAVLWLTYGIEISFRSGRRLKHDRGHRGCLYLAAIGTGHDREQ
jgi:hypothetical protein